MWQGNSSHLRATESQPHGRDKAVVLLKRCTRRQVRGQVRRRKTAHLWHPLLSLLLGLAGLRCPPAAQCSSVFGVGCTAQRTAACHQRRRHKSAEVYQKSRTKSTASPRGKAEKRAVVNSQERHAATDQMVRQFSCILSCWQEFCTFSDRV